MRPIWPTTKGRWRRSERTPARGTVRRFGSASNNLSSKTTQITYVGGLRRNDHGLLHRPGNQSRHLHRRPRWNADDGPADAAQRAGGHDRTERRDVRLRFDEEGVDDVFIRQLPDSGRKWRVSNGGGSAPLWSRDGKELFYRQGNRIMVTAVEGSSTLRIGPAEELISSDRIWFERFGNPTFGLAADDGLLIPMTEESDLHVRVVGHWRP